MGVISEELKTELDWVWTTRRSSIHIHEVTDLEYAISTVERGLQSCAEGVQRAAGGAQQAHLSGGASGITTSVHACTRTLRLQLRQPRANPPHKLTAERRDLAVG